MTNTNPTHQALALLEKRHLLAAETLAESETTLAAWKERQQSLQRALKRIQAILTETDQRVIWEQSYRDLARNAFDYTSDSLTQARAAEQAA